MSMVVKRSREAHERSPPLTRKSSTVQSEVSGPLLTLSDLVYTFQATCASTVALRSYLSLMWFKFQNILKDVANLQTGKAKTARHSCYSSKRHPQSPLQWQPGSQGQQTHMGPPRSRKDCKRSLGYVLKL